MDLATVDKLLTTTRSVRKRLDLTRPVPDTVIAECIEIALQAPSGSNRQGWHFVVVTDAEKRARIAEYYAKSYRNYRRRSARSFTQIPAGDPRRERAAKVADSATYLADHMHEVPVLIIPCINGRTDQLTEDGQVPDMAAQASLYGSILPATWSLMLALRARGLGAAWTTLHLVYAAEVAELLGIPDTVTQAALLPVAYYTGDDFRPASRVPARQITYWDGWGATR